MRKVITIEEIVGECETDLRSEDGLLVRVEDGTCSTVVSLEYRGSDTIIQEKGWNNKHFMDFWLRNSILEDRMRDQEMVAWDWMRMDKVKCALEVKIGDLLTVFRFIV